MAEAPEDAISVVVRIKPLIGDSFEGKGWVKNGENNVVRTDGTEFFTFDDVFDEFAYNDDVYCKFMRPLVISALEGFNTAVCAYGQSGAGKTHTLTGSASETGIVQQTFEDIFSRIALSQDRSYMLRVSYVEIYNEKVRDLLSDSCNDLPIYENKDNVPQIEGLTEQVVTKMEEVEILLQDAQERRQIGETNVNERSSRSHTIVRIAIESHDVLGGGVASRCSLMNLVDLAGSENCAATGAQGLRQKEGANINKSLLALSKVITSLADKQNFVPFRDSKLTRILKPSLGGNSKTVVVCCISPYASADTSSTLKFAKQVKRVKTRPVVNKASDDGVLSKCLLEIEHLKKQLAEKKSGELEREQDQRRKLAELMKSIISGTQGDGSLFSKRSRRQTWAPGNAGLCVTLCRSLSPPCKKERILGLCAISEAENAADSDDKLSTSGEIELTEKPCDPFYIPRYIPRTERLQKNICTTDASIQTNELPDNSTKDNRFESIIMNLEREITEKNSEIEKFQLVLKSAEEELNSLRHTLAELQMMGQTVERNKLCEHENNIENLKAELIILSEERISLLNSCNSLRRQISLIEESTKEEKMVLEASNATLRDELIARKVQFDKESTKLRDELDELKATTAISTDVHISEKNEIIKSLRMELNQIQLKLKEVEDAYSLVRESVLSELQAEVMEKMNKDNEELCQLRKTNLDLEHRINILIHENEHRATIGGSDQEIECLRDEVIELKEIIEKQKISLETAHKRELLLAEMEYKVARLITEKKELSARLAAKTHSVESLSQRNNAQRDELKAAEDATAEIDRKLKSVEKNNEMLRREQKKLEDQLVILRLQNEEALSKKESELQQANSKLSAMLKKEGEKNHKIALLDTDLIIAKKDLVVTRKALIELQERPFVDSERVRELESELEEVKMQLTESRRNKELAEQEAGEHKRMLSRAMDTVAKLEKCSNVSEYMRERSRLLKEIEVLTEKVMMETDAYILKEKKYNNEYEGKEKQELLTDIDNLAKQLKIAGTKLLEKDDYVQKIENELETCIKAKENIQEEVRRMKKHKQVGLEYITELKSTITDLRAECDKAKGILIKNASDTEAKVTQMEQSLANKTKEINALQKELNRMHYKIGLSKDDIENSGVRHNAMIEKLSVPFSQLKTNNNAMDGTEDINKNSFSCHHHSQEANKEINHEKPECKHQ